MDKAYNHNQFEDGLYADWEKSGKMRADNTSEKPSFTIPLPPPNVTGQLHLGHAAMLAIEDILIRYKKMTGHETLWIPGTDHAAIATENVVLKHHEKKSREEWPSREAFLADCRNFAEDKHDTIVNQMKKMGAWLDWSREAYTFDDTRNHSVNAIFKMLYEDGLIERGYRMINWSVGAQSVISDDELEWDEQKGSFFYIRCGEFVIGTVRSETKCANSPLVVHPDGEYARVKYTGKDGSEETFIFAKVLFDDKERLGKVFNLLDGEFEIIETMKGSSLVGQEFESETYAGKRTFKVLADDVIDMEKGTGAMSISVNHSGDDYAIAQKHGLKDYYIEKLDFKGLMTAVAGPCEGMPVKKARNVSGKLMLEQGLLVGKDDAYNNKVPLCYRSGTVIEPMISPQWFILVEKEFTDRHTGEKTTMKKQMQSAVRDEHVEIIPERFDKEYFRWIDNLQDWCISRQIWWGHQIPVWHDADGGLHTQTEQEILFVRHGESVGNRDGIVQSPSEPLTEKGEEDAKAVAKYLKDQNVGVIVTGKSVRTHKTAEIIAAELGIEIIEIPEIGAYDPGEVSGMTIEEIGRVAAIKYCRDNNKGENFEDFVARIKLGWEKLQNIRTNGKIAFVTNRSIFSLLEVIRSGHDVDEVFERRSKNSKLAHGIIAEWKILQDPEGENLRRDEDTLDTWFSSALWPFSTLGWPDEESLDLEKFYPNAVLETGWDILFFWVARMIMFGRYATGKYPYKTVYLHGMVCDEKGKKMSKSKGNGINPLESIDEVGADAVRLALVIGSTPGNPIPIGKNKINGYRNFVNKLWNAGRFVMMQVEQNLGGQVSAIDIDTKDMVLADRWILSRLSEVSQKVQESIEKYDISHAGDSIYHFVWGDFCDWYIETTKASSNPEKSTQVLYYVFGEILKLVHPLCPFVTEQLWRSLYQQDGSLMDEDFPVLDLQDDEIDASFDLLKEVVQSIRKVRTDHGLNPKDKLKVLLKPLDSIMVADEVYLRVNEGSIRLLANVSGVVVDGGAAPEEGMAKTVLNGLEVYTEVPYDEEAEKARHAKEAEGLEKQIAGFKGRLSNKAYTDKAPAHLVEETREQLRLAEEKLEGLK